ncbi:hypothetical protein C8R47DRAFT_681970 [Mycena vitilis]|nr:hypothetical protein C8R47DRAFT_681970 [Mycena vitilis]
MLWKTSVRDNFKGQVPVEEFLQTYLPATEDGDTINLIVKQSATKLTVAGNEARTATLEKKYAPSLIEYLETVVSNFPEDTKPEFCDTSTVRFPPIDPDDHKTCPDISVTRPGQPTPKAPRTWGWSDVGTVLELKLKVDMFRDNEIGPSDESQKALIQIAKSARSLLASGYCFVFVVAVIKTKARILRFDRAGYRTTAAFDWTESTDVIPTLFWRLYNPDRADAQPARIYGQDETISIPTPEEKRSMYGIWLKTLSYKKTPKNKRLSLEDATEHSRWVKARKDDKDVLCFTIGPPLSRADGLFSRATRVDRVLIKDDPTPTAYALKDAWRQLCRRPEKDFYDVIEKFCEDNDLSMDGMAQCLGSVELNAEGHKTNSARTGDQDRRHTRSLLTPVGISLKHFPSSKKLILALEAAVKHHEIAYKAGVMQRDVSEGNVMFDEQTMEGFLVDWDYAEFTAEGWNNFKEWFPDRAKHDPYADVNKSLKDLTGTYPFMAIELHEKEDTLHTISHDMESFYWLLIWMILRYTAHTHKDKDLACHKLFEVEDLAGRKSKWVDVATPLDEASPLGRMGEIMRILVMAQNPRVQEPGKIEFTRPGTVQQAPVRAPDAIPITYVDMEAVFDVVKTHSSWDTFPDCAALVFKAPRKSAAKTPGDSLSLYRTVLESNQTRTAVDGGSGSKRKRANEPADVSTTGIPTPDASGGESSGSAPQKIKISHQMKGKAVKPAAVVTPSTTTETTTVVTTTAVGSGRSRKAKRMIP